MADRIDGTVEVDGVDVSKIPLKSLRQSIAIIPQVNHENRQFLLELPPGSLCNTLARFF
jgi:ABC-type bacteriocin/lantibiotic exporter with double-glycine peptidase domain